MPVKTVNAVALPPAKKLHENPEIVSLYYHRLKYAYVTNNQRDIDFYYRLMKKALTPENSTVIGNALNVRQMSDLTNLLDAIQKKIFYCDFNAINTAQVGNGLTGTDEKQWFPEERHLEDSLFQNFDMLNELLGTNMNLEDRQFPTDYGPVDILASEPRTMYVIELKKGMATHHVVGQILKYARHFQKRSLYNLWDEVKMICVAGNYDEFTYTQLQQLNVATVLYSYDGTNLRLRNA